MTRRTMRASIRQANPQASESEIQEIYVRRLLACQGIDFDEILESMQSQGSEPPPQTTSR